ncbi:hypothetical protein B0H15DRAFT_872379, partial [Mycena belliarum]
MDWAFVRRRSRQADVRVTPPRPRLRSPWSAFLSPARCLLQRGNGGSPHFVPYRPRCRSWPRPSSSSHRTFSAPMLAAITLRYVCHTHWHHGCVPQRRRQEHRPRCKFLNTFLVSTVSTSTPYAGPVQHTRPLAPPSYLRKIHAPFALSGVCVQNTTCDAGNVELSLAESNALALAFDFRTSDKRTISTPLKRCLARSPGTMGLGL